MAIVCAVLYLILSKQNKDIASVLTIGACCMIVASAVRYLEPIFDFFQQLEALGNLDPKMIQILLKATGISILAEVSNMICTDAGNSALGKGIQILSIAVILWMSLPLFSGLIELVSKLLGNI